MTDSYLGEIRMVAFNFAPAGWGLCDGSTLTRAEYPELFDLLGTRYGGNGTTTFGLPDLQSRLPIGTGQGRGLSPRRAGDTGGQEAVALATGELPPHAHRFVASPEPGGTHNPAGALLAAQGGINLFIEQSSVTLELNTNALAEAGGSEPHENMQPFLVLNFVISLKGDSPHQPNKERAPEPFLGEVRLMGRDKVPNDGFGPCEGQIVPIVANTALFSLLSTTFGGNGQTTFALPDLRDAVPLDQGQGRGLSPRSIGEPGGVPSVVLDVGSMPLHDHPLKAASDPGELRTPAPQTSLARSTAGNAYQTAADQLVQMDTASVTSVGTGTPHDNVQPYLGLRYMIATEGVFPARG